MSWKSPKFIPRSTGRTMEKVTIQEASRRLNVSQRDIREYIRKGELKAERDASSESGRWLVELPEAGWEDRFKTYLNNLSEGLSPWWRAFEHKRGKVHYLYNVGVEEIMPDFLCGLRGDNLWSAVGHLEEERCPNCLKLANEQGLPLLDEEAGLG